MNLAEEITQSIQHNALPTQDRIRELEKLVELKKKNIETMRAELVIARGEITKLQQVLAAKNAEPKQIDTNQGMKTMLRDWYR